MTSFRVSVALIVRNEKLHCFRLSDLRVQRVPHGLSGVWSVKPRVNPNPTKPTVEPGHPATFPSQTTNPQYQHHLDKARNAPIPRSRISLNLRQSAPMLNPRVFPGSLHDLHKPQTPSWTLGSILAASATHPIPSYEPYTRSNTFSSLRGMFLNVLMAIQGCAPQLRHR